MGYIVAASVLTTLWDVLSEPVPSRRSGADDLLRQIAGKGWASKPDIDDIFYLTDSRLNRREVDIVALAAAFKLPLQAVYPRPLARSNCVMGSDSLAASDVAQFLILMERLGFELDATVLVDALLPNTKTKKDITGSELAVLWFKQYRHKSEPIMLRLEETAGGRETKRLTTATGYKAQICFNEAGQPLWLSVAAPKYRHRASPVETKCGECGATWYRGDPDSSFWHRREHKKRMAVLDPQPSAKVAAARLSENDHELVTFGSPRWKQREIYGRALAFKREFGYDFVQWHSAKGERDSNVQGFLFTDDTNTIVGACAFRLRERKHGNRWGLQWVWVCPRARRAGVLRQRWPVFRERFGDFHIEGPVSPAMEAFAVEHGDAALLGYAPRETVDTGALESVEG